jgi:glutamate synthase (NADPH/NADH) large chain
MAARESQLSHEDLGNIDQLKPIVTPGASDSATFDEVLELLVLSGRSLPHAMMMMIPGAWEKQLDLDPQLRDFYEYHSMIMEPWDGPAAVVFTDGDLVGATLDRNGLRPGRFVVTEDGFVILASEIGVAEISPDRIVRKGRLQPGKMFLIDTVAGQIVEDEQIKSEVAALEPWGQWLEPSRINLRDLPEREHIGAPPPESFWLHRGGPKGIHRSNGQNWPGADWGNGNRHPNRCNFRPPQTAL